MAYVRPFSSFTFRIKEKTSSCAHLTDTKLYACKHNLSERDESYQSISSATIPQHIHSQFSARYSLKFLAFP